MAAARSKGDAPRSWPRCTRGSCSSTSGSSCIRGRATKRSWRSTPRRWGPCRSATWSSLGSGSEGRWPRSGGRCEGELQWATPIPRRLRTYNRAARTTTTMRCTWRGGGTARTKRKGKSKGGRRRKTTRRRDSRCNRWNLTWPTNRTGCTSPGIFQNWSPSTQLPATPLTTAALRTSLTGSFRTFCSWAPSRAAPMTTKTGSSSRRF
mmetsp:Transcript_18215/g.31071  ORF Transcript_18215/g.31071 Transcript_18215/m.31071 type:complete len:207 (+) Transcript_18215:240-860(+)